ncbi:MAG: hypothetical protein EOO88_33950 [Pedobacter sp.]|nr:MAG: hypothetical protein EOO88_33950 [Pedobacter sp.]
MGRLTGGPYYDLIGRTGNNVGRRVRGKNLFYMRPHTSNRPRSAAQLAVMERLGMAASWLSWVAPMIEIGFQDHEENESPMNAAVGYLIKNAITGVAPLQTIDYPKVLFSRGRVSMASAAEVATTAPSQLDFSWDDICDNGIGSLTDMANFVVYNVDKDYFAVIADAVPRSAMSYDMSLPASFSGDTVHIYTHFVSANGKMVSNSYYLGTAIVL